MACVDAYRAYGGSSYLAKAINLWQALQETQITDSDIARGQHDGIKFSWPCQAGLYIGTYSSNSAYITQHPFW
jgi:hypothetical protein